MKQKVTKIVTLEEDNLDYPIIKGPSRFEVVLNNSKKAIIDFFEKNTISLFIFSIYFLMVSFFCTRKEINVFTFFETMLYGILKFNPLFLLSFLILYFIVKGYKSSYKLFNIEYDEELNPLKGVMLLWSCGIYYLISSFIILYTLNVYF